jgi:hypothetical protein
MNNISSFLDSKASNPWQARESIGFFRALWKTIKYVLLKPGEFFENLDIQDSIKEPYLFYFIVSFCISIITVAIEILFKNGAGSFISASLFIFLFISIGIFIGSGVLHLGVMLLGGEGGFKGTLNVLAYNASTSVFLIIPFIGVVISGIWGIIVGVKGFKKVHNLSTTRAVMAYFGLFFIIGVIALLAAIAIPNFLKARANINDAAAKATVRTISTAIEAYAAANNGKYPISESVLVNENPQYLLRSYSNGVVLGYKYLLDLDSNLYRIVAKPESCGATGTKILTIKTGGVIQEEECMVQRKKIND